MSQTGVFQVIQVEDLSKTFRSASGPVFALRNVSFQVPRGEILAVCGPSGAGKTTLLRCLAFLEKPDCGRIIFDGVDALSLSAREIREFRKGISVVFQGFNLLSSRTATDNVSLALEIRGIKRERAREEARSYLDMVHMGHRHDFYPSQLSGGERQRIAIARALVTRPRALILDEPTSSLDPATARSILNSVLDINQRSGLTVIIVTHQIDLVGAITDRSVFIEGGRISEAESVPCRVPGDTGKRPVAVSPGAASSGEDKGVIWGADRV